MASRKFDFYNLLSVKYLCSHERDSLRIFIMYFYSSVTCAHFNHLVLLLYILYELWLKRLASCK